MYNDDLVWDIWTLVSSVMAFIITFGAAANVIISAIKKYKEPETNQNKRLQDIEARLNNYDNRVDDMEEGARVTQRAILALLSHAIDGDKSKQVQDARNDLNDYLINK